MSQYVVGGQSLVLSQADFIAQGGEGALYGQADYAYKIYHDSKHMIPQKKMDALSQLSSDYIVKPLQPVCNHQQRTVGYQMHWVKDTLPLVKLFSNGARQQLGVTPESTLALIQQMQTVIQSVHDAGMVMVDGNEMNYLVDGQSLTQAYFIDVDSYQTPAFAAKVLMPSIRDWSAQVFDARSDWFSFAIIACQLLVGIHPFKGRHPQLKSKDLKQRQLKNLSIFNAQTTLPPTVRDFDLIPEDLKNWFVALFEQGKRCPPPDIVGSCRFKPTFQYLTQLHQFETRCVVELPEPITGYAYVQGQHWGMTAASLWHQQQAYPKAAETVCVWQPDSAPCGQGAGIFQVYREHGVVCVADEHGVLLWRGIRCDDFMLTAARIYVKHGAYLYEIKHSRIGQKDYFSSVNQWSTMPLATQVCRGCWVQNILGKTFLSTPYAAGKCTTVAVPEMDGSQVLEGAYVSGVSVFTVYQNNRYHRYILIWDASHARYQIRQHADIDYRDVNFCVLNHGLVLLITAEETLEVFQATAAEATVKVIHDPQISTDMRLFSAQDQAIFCLGHRVYQWHMKH